MYFSFQPSESNELFHSGVAHDNNPPGRGSGRYPYGSGKRPYQCDTDHIADKIYNKAKEKEQKITKDLKNIAKKTNTSLYDIDYRLKSKESIKRKINKKSIEKNISVQKSANDINDALRYTLILDENNFVQQYKNIKQDLLNNGYNEIKCKNYFDMYKKGLVKHKSIQSLYNDSSNYTFELQFHTKSSQNAKNKKTKIYEEARKVNIDQNRKLELENKMVKLAERVKDPPNISKIKSY